MNLHCFVGRIRRLRRIRHEQCVRCQQSAPPGNPGGFLFMAPDEQLLAVERQPTFCLITH
ncbi:hypothetical protein BMT65_17735 [Escherichia coli]|nr:hypothetical protein BMT65_17735 [Escherichia coli]OOH63967.1 hypothetical protein BMT64_01960 [Escherichia coli]OOH84040.1 hypothetical protein BMT63_14460 [Escherichia coli]TXW53993.1 hypothetical protein D4M45_18200 [Escherichia coli]